MSSTPVASLRTANKADVEYVVELWNRAAGPTKTPGTVDDVRRLLWRDPDALLVAEIDGKIAGTLIVGFDGWRCHMYRLAVSETARRQHIATQLVDEAQRRARLLGATRIDAMVDLDNAAAIEFWEGCGFERDAADARWFLHLRPSQATI